MKKGLSVLAFLFLVLSACQKDPSRTSTELQDGVDSTPRLVQAADGTLYSASCLRENAAEIQSSGQSAMNSCRMAVKFGDSGTGEVDRGKFFTSSSYAYIVYPPTYWNTNQYSTNSNQYGTTSYNPAYDTNYYNNPFCSYIFGGNYNYNCFYLFGYTSPSTYNTYYNPSCSYCLYGKNVKNCAKRCLRRDYIYAY